MQGWMDETRPMDNEINQDPHMFMTAEGIDKATLGAALREYREIDTPWPGSPWQTESTDVLSVDFINWFRWERI
jgi:hypothetical protein